VGGVFDFKGFFFSWFVFPNSATGVITRLVRVIHSSARADGAMDGPDKPGHDVLGAITPSHLIELL